MPESIDALQLKDVEKQYGALRPLRVRDLNIPGCSLTSLVGLDEPAAETFVNLITGATLPEKGRVQTLGQDTASIANADEWLRFIERIAFISRRIVLLETMTVAQNLALPFDLQLDPIPPEIVARVESLAEEAHIDTSTLRMPMTEASGLLRARVRLARALALQPEMLLVEHPSAELSSDEGPALAKSLKEISEDRALTTVTLTMDEKFAKALGGRLLVWQPATGDFHARRRWF
jgi:ABC-type lipoprotein export system ATPase subunit